MTAQIDDMVFHRGTEFAITAEAGSGLFDPYEYGFRPEMMGTHCSRGYYLHYQIVREELQLAKLTIAFSHGDDIAAKSGNGPKLFGKTPGYAATDQAWVYGGLAQPIGFSGGLLLGADFIDDLYVHAGFQTPWKYGLLYEAIFEWGHLVACHDRSAEMAALRDEFAEHLPDPDQQADSQKFWTAFDRCFALKYTAD